MISSFILKLIRLITAAVFLGTSLVVGPVYDERTPPSLAAPLWPRWVHEHWVWENSGTQESAMALADGYLERGVPVGAVIIDRPWATDSNTFVPDPERYPDLGEYVNMFHEKDIRVMLWATSVVNETASNFAEAKEKGYFLSSGRTVPWWGGRGAFIDYTNPEAVDWWHSQMDRVLDMGIDGWKVDGTDPYVMLLGGARGKSGERISWSDYASACYGDFFNYTREKLGDDRVISARPVDDQIFRAGFPLVFTEREVNFAGWVGDNDNDWGGLRHALNSMFTSSLYNFVSYGSDIGGFRSDDRQHKDVFIRWAQLGAFCPVMENGGGGEHRPWMFDGQTLDIYRKFTVLHTELIPYIYSQAAYSYELEVPTMRPQAGNYIYLLGDDILVAPFYMKGDRRAVVFPRGEWIYMFDEEREYGEGTGVLNFGLDEFPVFIRKGAIIPMEVESDLTGFGTRYSAGFTTVLVYPEEGRRSFGLYEEDAEGTVLSYTKEGGRLTLSAGATDRSLLFRVWGEGEPVRVSGASGEALERAESAQALSRMDAGYFTDGPVTWYAVRDASAGAELVAEF